MSRVALIGENSIGYVETLLRIWNNNDCAVLLDWRIPFPTAVEMMIEADVHTCFIESTNNFNIGTIIPFGDGCPSCGSTDQQGGESGVIETAVANEENSNQDNDVKD